MNILVWFRNDLRIHDHPALHTAVQDGDTVVPVFVFNDDLLHGKHAGSNRNRFLLESLEDLRTSLKNKGADLVIRHGDAATELAKLAEEVKAEQIYYTADFSPYAIQRDKAVTNKLQQTGVQLRSFGGRLAVDHLNDLRTKSGSIYKVFTPFWKNWQKVERRHTAPAPSHVPFSSDVRIGTLPKLSDITKQSDLSSKALPGGETAGRKRLHDFLDEGIKTYHTLHNDMAADGSSRLSAYIHFGCVSVREIETMLPHGDGASAWHRQLAWRDFYNYILFHFPGNAKHEFQERYQHMKWGDDKDALQAWQDGQTGYPVVDAAMRQLKQEGWMHNRGRLIVGSFLSKDLWLDWRLGEQYFMRMLMDGDQANNNGNWQWIASVGVDPAPVFRRLYNPASQQKTYDPHNTYVRRYVPELQNVPDKYITEPWKMPEAEQQKAGCSIGTDYPAPIVDHAESRLFALEQYRGSKKTP